MTEPARRYPARPILCVGAVIVADGRVVVVQRGRPPALGEWSIPGGVVDIGETLPQAVAREAFEETGLVVDVGPVLKIIERIDAGEDGRVEYHYVVLDYLCSPRSGTLTPGSDAADARWVTTSELEALAPTDAVREVVAAAFAHRPWAASTRPTSL